MDAPDWVLALDPDRQAYLLKHNSYYPEVPRWELRDPKIELLMQIIKNQCKLSV